jgi:hypothetical protein
VVDEARIKHLELIQATVTRFASNSFLIKGWTLTIAAAFLALVAKNSDWKYAAVASIPILMFWMLDGYYLHRERLARALWDDARQPDTKVDLFSMDVRHYEDALKVGKAVWSYTLRYFYGALLVVNIAFLIGAIIR